MTNFIEEYQLQDSTLCDSLIDLFWDADDDDDFGGGMMIPAYNPTN